MLVEEYDSVEVNLRKQTFPQLFITVTDLADALDANALYNENRPNHACTGDTLREHVAIMKQLSIGADRGDVLLRDQRQQRRDFCELDVVGSVSYMKSIAIHRRDPTLLRTLTLPPKETAHKNSRRANSSHQNVPIRLDVKHVRGETGWILIQGTHVRGGGPYLINLCKGEPTSDASWYNPGGHHASCAKIIMKNLEPANRYYVRMRTDGPEGPGPWSQPVSIIVL
ncbi:fibronectin type III domain-containing protein [Geomonas anaerohicana]|uniref:Fibronectin type III domain-containing protein n=1 Tax=Geomonas anaerohicana TaxID=2798583 RepID=A0ABS0YLD3_9BACT|nr:fibronectin type III domain-containing protein [Geomonas anaerohicana]MBJ6752674.1 fibronectin type III domain-containing protein [Geomonas anaerohicana]